MNPDIVTHPSTNQAQHRLTSQIETNALRLRQYTSITGQYHSRCHSIELYANQFKNQTRDNGQILDTSVGYRLRKILWTAAAGN